YTFDPTSAGTPSLELLWENRDGSALSPYPKFNYSSVSYTSVYKYGTTYPALTSGTRYSNRPNIWFMSAPTAVPPAASAVTPTNAATAIEINTNLSWQHNGGQPTSYKVYCGTDNPPTNLVNGDVVTTSTYDITGYLHYATTYYWKVVPHNSFGDATSCPVWSFVTRDDPTIYTFPYTENFTTFPNTNWQTKSGNLADPVVFGADGLCKWTQDDWLNTAGGDKAAELELYVTMNGWLITPPVNITSENFKLKFDLAFLKWNQPPTTTPAMTGTDDRFAVLVGNGFDWSTSNIIQEWNNSGSAYVLNNISPYGETVTLSLPYTRGAARIAFWAGSTISNADNDIMIHNISIYEEQELPVELSSFTAQTTQQNFVSLHWVTQSETNALGYYIYRSQSGILSDAVQLNQLIQATNTANEHSYSYLDEEVENHQDYYYWLQNVDISGNSNFHGPIHVSIEYNDGQGDTPTIQPKTSLLNAYPNPFNPQTTIQYEMKDAGSVHITIWNTKGQLIRDFKFNHAAAGHYQFAWNGTDMKGNDVATGVYYYRMNSGNYTDTKKMVLMK
ncbi:MAG TPA: FlgD immunoglobulin-like domain containing protein, partial [Candidatus Cloacimonadota bacterium]|nr:FlgD immunoglobulin-like domain containing protein [Candidatus Cloacimonadota bacterium]